MFNDVSGFVPVIPHALMGLPKELIFTSSQRNQRFLRFILMIDRASGVSTDEIICKMSKMLAKIASLERSGQYRCRLEVCFTAFGDCHSDKIHTSCSVLVKSENQLFDVKRLCYPIIHPSMLRLFMFAWEESLPLKYDDYRVSGYGKAFEHWKESAKEFFIKGLNENNEKIICVI